jgi:hypothetical protein
MDQRVIFQNEYERELYDRAHKRDTFTIPAGREAVRDNEGRATGQTRPRGSDVQPQTTAGARTFGTGATRDLDANKLDFEGFLSPLALERFAQHMHAARKMPDGTMRASDNWQLGIPLDVYMKSLWRHFFGVWKLHRGLTVTEVVKGEVIEKDLETELCAVIFNASGMLHEILKAKKPEWPAPGCLG